MVTNLKLLDGFIGGYKKLEADGRLFPMVPLRLEYHSLLFSLPSLTGFPYFSQHLMRSGSPKSASPCSHGERVVSENLELFDDRLACIRPLVKDNRVEADSGHELGDRFSSLTIMAVDDENALAARSVDV